MSFPRAATIRLVSNSYYVRVSKSAHVGWTGVVATPLFPRGIYMIAPFELSAIPFEPATTPSIWIESYAHDRLVVAKMAILNDAPHEM